MARNKLKIGLLMNYDIPTMGISNVKENKPVSIILVLNY